ncbi:hypothetical protein BGP77_02515 [Saccharospirillum sp. MSK14-1]|nr:hypothetical protein BGP77_02515 [Saccharospirillum sp. MSK14-1]
MVCLSACTNDPPPLSDWQGRWWGPEGTYLDIAGGPEQFQLTIASLDGPVDYIGVAQGDQILFDLNDESATIYATDGEGTGMKWLVDNEHCLKVEPGDGYCRDE